MASLGNPRKWRYTWEALAHIPTLRLFLFSHQIRPLKQCNNLKVSLNFEELLLLVSWSEEIDSKNVDFSIRVPVPRVLVDVGSLTDFKAMEDHIEVKLVLLLPINHPLIMNFDLLLNISDEEPNRGAPSFDSRQSLSVDSDLKWLSSQAGVHLFCKQCSTKLTKKPLRSFIEMPSADWREVADNWFGACCCSFGGISEKLVKHYAKSYLFSKGTSLIDMSCIVVTKDDLAVFPDCSVQSKESEGENNVDISTCITSAMSDLSVSTLNNCCITLKDEEVTESLNPLKNHKSLLNISLGNGFMVRNPNLSKEVDWIELSCPQCSSLLGAYPAISDAHASADGGVRLFKCYTSTGLPVGGPDDIFRKYTLHRMFINQLMELANDELSFRTVVKDLRTRTPVLQIVLLNSDAWSCSGYCLDIVKPLPRIDMHPVVKVLFSDCSNTTDAQLRTLEEWATKNQADEIFMLRRQVKDLIESLKSAMSLPLSCSSMQGLSLSSIEQ